MSRNAGVQYRIDEKDEITFVDESWPRFAEENDGVHLVGPGLLGRSLWDFITDAATRQLYEQILARVRKGQVAQFSLRCDGPACRRLLEMTITAGEAGAVEFATNPLRLEDRKPVPLLAAGTERSADFLRSCAWCNRIDVGGGEWAEVEDAAERLRLFELHRMPRLTHTICEACLAAVKNTLANMPPIA